MSYENQCLLYCQRAPIKAFADALAASVRDIPCDAPMRVRTQAVVDKYHSFAKIIYHDISYGDNQVRRVHSLRKKDVNNDRCTSLPLGVLFEFIETNSKLVVNILGQLPQAPTKHNAIPGAFVYKRELRNGVNVELSHNGTTVSLYYCADKWCIGSSAGAYLNDSKWIGPRTYQDVVFDIVDVTTLHKGKCYIIKFVSHEFHLTGVTGAWLIDIISVDSTDPVPYPHTTTGAVIDYCVSDDDHSEINRNNANALSVALTEMNNIDNGIGNIDSAAVNNTDGSAGVESLIDKNWHYGYTVSMKQPDPSGYSRTYSVVVESTLMSFLRKKVYDLPKNITLTSDTRLKYILIRAYLSVDYLRIRTLLHAFRSHFNRLDAFADEVMVEALRLTSLINPPTASPLVTYLALELKKQKVTGYGMTSRSIASDILKNPNNIAMWMDEAPTMSLTPEV